MYKYVSFQRIFGELYDVDNQMLKRLDKLENHPHTYLRVPLEVEFWKSPAANPQSQDSLDGQTLYTCSCMTYTLIDYKEILLTFPYLETYSDNKQSSPYVEHSKRDPRDSIPNFVKKSSKL